VGKKDTKKAQLGMDPGTASNRLVKDILWNYIVKSEEDTCYRCKQKLDRDNFSIEHIEPWLHSEDPLDLFFNLENIAYSHKSCNYAAARKPHKIYESEAERLKAKYKRKYWSKSPEVRKQRRREQYLRTGT
jgi:hypothetical protein